MTFGAEMPAEGLAKVAASGARMSLRNHERGDRPQKGPRSTGPLAQVMTGGDQYLEMIGPPQLNFTFTPARTMSSVSLTSRAAILAGPSTTGAVKYCLVPKSACRYSTFRVTAPHDSTNAAHSPPTPAVQPVRVWADVTVPKTGLETVTSVPAKAAPAVPKTMNRSIHFSRVELVKAGSKGRMSGALPFLLVQ